MPVAEGGVQGSVMIVHDPSATVNANPGAPGADGNAGN